MTVRRDQAPVLAVGLVSAAALAYEVLLVRLFAIVHWHHLVAIAIGLALLGYGVSGTFLALWGRRLLPHFAPAFVLNAFLFGLSSALCAGLAQRIPFDPEALIWDPWQFPRLAGAFLLLAVPFFAAANCIALSLTRFPGVISRLYGVDLLGAGLGAVGILGLLLLAHPADALLGVSLLGLAVAVLAAWQLHWRPRAVLTAAVLAGGTIFLAVRPVVEPAPYKDLARTLAVTGATVEQRMHGPAGTLTLVSNTRVPLRTAEGLSLQTQSLPPPQRALFIDGEALDTIPAAGSGAADYGFQQYRLSALPYVLLSAPRVAVLNAAAGSDVRQALALGAARVVAVEPNPMLHDLLCGEDAVLRPTPCADPRVDWVVQAPRAYLGGVGRSFDLVTLTAAAQGSGLDALAVDFDLTREALKSYLGHLAPGGLLMIEGPSRVPPRLALRMLATAQAALQARGSSVPREQLLMLRGWRRFVLLVAPEPLGVERIAAARDFAASRGFDLVWVPGMEPGEANRFQQLQEPWFQRGAAAILELTPARPESDRFDLVPTTDDRPFPLRFTRWPEVWQALAGGDPNQRAQLDLGLLLGAAMLLLVAPLAALLILLPLLALPAPGAAAGRSPRLRTFGYFGLVGFAFLFVEIGWIQRLQLFLGHPVYATSAVLATFLVFAGLGSLWSQRRGAEHAARLLWAAVAAIGVLSLLYLLFLPGLLQQAAAQPLALRLLLVLLVLAPLAFAMGMPFPLGLRGTSARDGRLVPWAWGINGFASVIAAGSTPLLAAEIGFSGLTLIAVAAYLLLPLLRVAGPSGALPQAPES